MSTIVYDETHEAMIAKVLVGRKVVAVEQRTNGYGDEKVGVVTLDDGTILILEGNAGCGGCSSGWYDLEELNTVDNIITAVEVDRAPGGDDYDHYKGVYTIFVFADNERINLATFTGSDGNGYYGTGFRFAVRRPA